jgi:hypothetical protein
MPNSIILYSQTMQHLAGGQQAVAGFNSPDADSVLFIVIPTPLVTGLDSLGAPVEGDHLIYTIRRADGSAIGGDVANDQTVLTVPQGGSIEFRAYHYRKSDSKMQRCNHVDIGTNSGAASCTSARILFNSDERPEPRIEFYLSFTKFALEAPEQGHIAVTRMFGQSVMTNVIGSTNMPAAVAGAPEFGLDGWTYNQAQWNDSQSRVFVRAKLNDAAGTKSNFVNVLSSAPTGVVIQFAFTAAGGAPAPSDPTITVEVKEKGFGGGFGRLSS